MTEQEAIEVLSDFDKQVSAKADGAYQSTIGEMACKVAINALEEIQQYREIGTVKEIKIREAQSKRLSEAYLDELGILREYQAIGTVEECREAVEKQTEKKVFVVFQGNYALSKNMDAFSTRELADGFRKHIRKESNFDGYINIFELEVDGAVLKEEDM